MKAKLFCIVLFLFQIAQSIGQVDSSATKNHFFWVNLSPQFISSSNLNILPTPSIGFNYSLKHLHNIRIKYYQTQKNTFDTTNTDEPSENKLIALKSFSLQYGIGKFLNKNIIGTFYCGISFNDGIYRNEVIRTVNHSGSSWFGNSGPSTSYYYDYSFFKNVKIPLTVNFMIPIGPPFAIGFEVFANLGKYPDYGFALNFSLGHVANKRARVKKVKYN